MQTYLPYPNFIGSAKVLDSRRLGKQRVENLQIMQGILGKRVAYTLRPEPTGAFETVFYNRNYEEIPLNELDVFDVWYQESTPITSLVPTSPSEWRIEDHTGYPTRNNPVVRMWLGYAHVLMHYQNVICDEWADRGHKDTCREKTAFLYTNCMPEPAGDIPPWFGDEDFHRAHRSNLLRKHPKYYSQFFTDVPDDLPYMYPVPII